MQTYFLTNTAIGYHIHPKPQNINLKSIVRKTFLNLFSNFPWSVVLKIEVWVGVGDFFWSCCTKAGRKFSEVADSFKFVATLSQATNIYFFHVFVALSGCLHFFLLFFSLEVFIQTLKFFLFTNLFLNILRSNVKSKQEMLKKKN